jgi:hypothetical protein
MGKAYFEERRDDLAGSQLAMAKELDPKDPTPWFYDAIRKQLDNRPVEALRDLERSIELNDKRAVYRSRLLLDEDLAVRGVSLARIYDDLGFDQLALNEGTKSLGTDPADHSAHRFLSDTYARLPRHEIARVSELLQAQLLQPININPVQPRLAEAKLFIPAGAGPAEAAFNEFTPLFARDRMQLTASGVAGNNSTVGDEVVVSGLWNRFSYSLGQFHYGSDGFRENNDIRHDIYNAFAQAALTEKLDLQVEYRHRETGQGDMGLNFDPSDFSTTDRRDVEQDTWRLGLHLKSSPRADFIASLIHTDRRAEAHELVSGLLTDEQSDAAGYDAQAQYLFHGERLNLVAGLGSAEIDNKQRFTVTFVDFGFTDTPEVDQYTVDQDNAYVYANFRFTDRTVWTLGLSFDSFDDETLALDELNPKLGLQWDITERLRLRAAALKTLKRFLIADQTLEPTQVAGFNQFFDDPNGTKAWRYGIGLDAIFTPRLYGGAEVSKRDAEVPLIQSRQPPQFSFQDQEEELYRAYLYWMPHPHWAVNIETLYENTEKENAIPVETLTVPVAVRYFNPRGIFAELGATFVSQEVDAQATPTFSETRERFVVLDAAVGYRLPERRGIVSFEVRNLMDKAFLYQDLDFIASQPLVNPRFVPDRTVLVRLTLAF